MNTRYSWRRLAGQTAETLRLRLARQEALLVLALLGALCGLVSGFVICIFRLLINASPMLLLGGDHAQDFEHLNAWTRFWLPSAGGAVLGLIFHYLQAADRQLGVVYVLERMAYHEALLPVKNAVVQFFGAVVCILAGHSVGREGPSIHIGATAGSWLGRRLQLPNNSSRVLVACGCAGAIAAAFDTPLAGVVFAIEVVLLEYTLPSVIPIILAAVSATALSLRWFDTSPLIGISNIGLGSPEDLMLVLGLGLLVGILAALFVRTLVGIAVITRLWPISLRLTLAGVLTGIIAQFAPEVMGIGYDTIDAIMLSQLGVEALVLIVVAKFVATGVGLGLGLPAGVIGPSLVIGAAFGGLLSLIGVYLDIGQSSLPFYAMLAMGAMMGASLNAPLAALTALLEMSGNPQVILPGMLAIVVACITSWQVFRTPSVFIKLMEVRGLDYVSHPIAQFLQRLGVAYALERQVQIVPVQISRKQLESLRTSPSNWVLIRIPEQSQAYVAATAELLIQLENIPIDENGEKAPLDLLSLALNWRKAAPLPAQATLWGALAAMDKAGVDTLYVLSSRRGKVEGVVTRRAIERSYHTPVT